MVADFSAPKELATTFLVAGRKFFLISRVKQHYLFDICENRVINSAEMDARWEKGAISGNRWKTPFSWAVAAHPG